MPLPADPKLAITALAAAVDKLSGQLAAATAFVLYYAKEPVSDDDVRFMQGVAQTIAPDPIGSGMEGAPKLHASRGVERLRAQLQEARPTQSGASRT
jgi:hypothetical protein